jgi:hypothetical protein
MHIAQDELRSDYTIAISPKAIHAAQKVDFQAPQKNVDWLEITRQPRATGHRARVGKLMRIGDPLEEVATGGVAARARPPCEGARAAQDFHQGLTRARPRSGQLQCRSAPLSGSPRHE